MRMPILSILACTVLFVLSGTLRAEPAPANPQPAGPASGPAEKLALQEQQIAEKYEHLEKVLLRMAELSEATDPRRAALLKKAVQHSGQRQINGQFEQVIELLRKERLARAIEGQAGLDQDLRALLELLESENRAKRIESEKARIRQYLKILNGLIKQQKDLQGRTADAPGGNPKDLSGEQGQLAEKTGGLAKDIKQNEEGKASEKGDTKAPGKEPGKEEGKSADQGKKSGKEQGNGKDQGEGKAKGEGEGKGQGQSQGKGQGQGEGQGQGQGQPQPQDQSENPARKRLDAARERMREAQERLEEAQREGALEKQEAAIRELEAAKANLEEILRQLREEEIARTLAMLEGRFRKMLDLQVLVYDGTKRLDAVPEEQRSDSHPIESRRLGNKETEIVVECDKALLLLRDDGTAVAFPEALGQARDDMQQVAVRLAQAKVGQVTQAIEEDIIAALKEMIEALKKAQKDLKDRKKPPGQSPSGERQGPPLVDALAELRMIRALQMRVNDRTERYSKLIDGEQADKADVVDALQRLAEREQRIYRVTRDLEMGKNK